MTNNNQEDLEEHYFGSDRKLHREDRKRKQAKDRSKYKKSNLNKLPKDEVTTNKNLHRGRVLSVQSKGITVEHEGIEYLCSLRGALKKVKTTFKNLVTVGDFVLFDILEGEEGAIAHVEHRKSTLSRADNLSRRKEQLIASNIDQVLITVSVVTPPLKPFLVDRYIIAAQKGGMDPVIILNKIDLLEEEDDTGFIAEQKELMQEFVTAYSQTGIPVIEVSILNEEGIEKIEEIMKDKSSVFSGQSGVGKSTLINKITGLELATREIVKKTRKGSHTTTTAQLIRLKFGGWCIDTPGIKSFGVWNLEKDEIEQYYTEIFEKGRECKFPDCSHTHEIDCAVKDAVENGDIKQLRYNSYTALLAAIDEEHKRR
jgi:ribosome biogenesis GTPase / thiamine phosphate phosphatase